MAGLIAGTSQTAWVLWRKPGWPSSMVSQWAPHCPRASSRLEDPHREAGFGEIGGGGEAVDASPDDDDVVVLQFSPLGATPARR
jgi:hypothetical protein